jgi:hypothetical protein
METPSIPLIPPDLFEYSVSRPCSWSCWSYSSYNKSSPSTYTTAPAPSPLSPTDLKALLIFLDAQYDESKDRIHERRTIWTMCDLVHFCVSGKSSCMDVGFALQELVNSQNLADGRMPSQTLRQKRRAKRLSTALDEIGKKKGKSKEQFETDHRQMPS